MPGLAAFYGIAVYMYVRDHGIAHFHARHGDNEAVIEVATEHRVAGKPAARSGQAGQRMGGAPPG